MGKFVSEYAKKYWYIFSSTGNLNVYLLYFAVQHSDEKVLDFYANEQLQDQGMEL